MSKSETYTLHGVTIMAATPEDREYAWRHAFAYADAYVPTDDAIAYASHYAGLVADEEDMAYWPPHGPTFADWLEDLAERSLSPL